MADEDVRDRMEQLQRENARLAAEVAQLRVPMAPMTYGLDDTRALLAAQMRITQHLHGEVRRLRREQDAAQKLLDTWAVLRKYADQYPVVLVAALDALARAHGGRADPPDATPGGA